MPLPKVDSPEWAELIKVYPTSTPEQRDKWAEELGYGNRDNFINAMTRRKIFINQATPSITAEQPTPVINLPPVELKKYTPINAGRIGNPETQVLHLTDWHDGEITPSFDHGVLKVRAEHLFQATMRITTLHRNSYPVNDLVIPITGDMVAGENVYQGAKVSTISCGARDQVITLAFPLLTELILSLKQEFKTVTLECVRGNHGRYSREAPATSNWDLMLYDLLKTKLEQYDIKVNISNEFYKMVDIQGHRFFLVHLDQFRATQGVPWFAMTKGLQSWYVTYGGFDYVVGGHFHRDDFLRINSRCKLIMGASMVTDDPFTQEVVKTSSIPCQWTFGVHKNKGITWPYSLIVDDKYFPAAARISNPSLNGKEAQLTRS
ncbi:MAG: hypothetical protein MUP81_00105 [Dehalococcoidia bacterium]|nr:hypothetical protein [Dehalococcoidia bacterium]